jgi:hypothetical protein
LGGIAVKRFIGLFLCLALLLSAAVAVGGGDKDFKELKKDLAKAVTSKDADAISEALIDVLVYGGRDAVELIVSILEKIPQNEDVIYWQLVKGVCTVTDREAMVALAEAVVRHKRDYLGKDLLFALQNNRCRNVSIVHQAVLEECGYDMQKMSIESLVNMEEDVSVDALIAALKKVKDRAVRAEIADALRMLTRADCGESAEDWEKWWEVSRDQGMGIGRKEGDGEGGESRGGGYTGTVVDELERYRRDKMFGGEDIKLKALVITDY